MEEIMRYGVTLPNMGVDAHMLAQLAMEAEISGWDGVFVWDCLYGISENEPERRAIYEPWSGHITTSSRRDRSSTRSRHIWKRRLLSEWVS